ncbi:E3 ubiquitin-protein ligase CHIP [Cocos nucifera]|uniref:E3 ubiquitin-protein ligase CHIP n=1 Tax=Cocos nucifera TaxID=13894 RepID=A0A8K0HZB4_COCNU|nr:E3 ubiquitin-protein ligase CHIP [Cocos nucifera]
MEPRPVPASVAEQAELRRREGNAAFKKGRFGAAIDAYTEALTLCSSIAVYWTNRALCYKKRKETCEKALAEYHFLGDSRAEDSSEDAANDRSAQLELLKDVFSKAAQADTPTQVPDYLCCKITFDIFRDPVITPSGVTYERAVLLEHLKQVGKFDPLTREPLEQQQLVPNLAIKQAVQVVCSKTKFSGGMSWDGNVEVYRALDPLYLSTMVLQNDVEITGIQNQQLQEGIVGSTNKVDS